jgi:hypothetical protein
MKKDKKYDAVKEARKIRHQLSKEYSKDPEAFKKALKEAGEKYDRKLKEKNNQ